MNLSVQKLKKFYKNKKVFVTGATGFKGSWIVKWLELLGAKVYGIGYLPNDNKKFFYSLGLNKKRNFKIVDIRDSKSLKKTINTIKPGIIIHMAAQPLISASYVNPHFTYSTNAIGTLNVLQIVNNSKYVKSLVCITSDKCYKDSFSTKGFKENDQLGGEDPYSGSKACAEIIVKTYIESFFKKKKIGVASARAGNVIGGGDFSQNRLIPDSVLSLKKKRKIFLRNPKFNRPWQHVLEPIYGYLILAKKLYENPRRYEGAYNFGPENNTLTTVENIVKKIIKFWGHGTYKINRKSMYYEQKNLQLDITKAKKILNWKPVLTIDESVKFTISWYKRFFIDKENSKKITIDHINEYSKKIR